MISKILLDEIKDQDLSLCVHSIFDRAINLTYQNKFITLLSNDKPIEPYAIKLIELPKVNINDIVTIHNCILSVNDYSIDLSKLDVYDLSYKDLRNINSKEIINHNLKVLSKTLLEANKEHGILPLIYKDKYVLDAEKKFIEKDFENFIKATSSNDESSLIEAAIKICGYGQGLTPYMDDYLCGYFIASVYLGEDKEKVISTNKSICKALDNKTTALSYHMLKVASIGLANEYLNDLLFEILEHGENITEKTKRVISFGSSSGSDMLCGVLRAFEKYLMV